MDHSKASKLLNWNPKYTAEQALTELKPEIMASSKLDEVHLEGKSKELTNSPSKDDVSGKIFA